LVCSTHEFGHLELSGGTGRRYAPVVIVVVGDGLVSYSRGAGDRVPRGHVAPADVAAGRVAAIATAAARAGAPVQLVAKVGEDTAGDAVVLDLARQGVGHVAVLRDPTFATPGANWGPESETEGDTELGVAIVDASETTDGGPDAQSPTQPAEGPALEAADVELGLRYLSSFAVVVAATPLSTDALQVIADAAAYAGAQLVTVVEADSDGPAIDGATILAAPPEDPDGRFAELVGRYAAALDSGADAAAAFRSASAAVGWEPAAAT
jgi:hypothetical protein